LSSAPVRGKCKTPSPGRFTCGVKKTGIHFCRRLDEPQSKKPNLNCAYRMYLRFIWSSKTKIKIYRTIVVPVVLYGCETWLLTLREKRRLRVLENRVLRRIFGPKRDKETGEWRKLDNEGLNDLYCSPNIVRVIRSRKMRWAGHVARIGRGEVYTGFWWGNLRKREHLEDPVVDGRIILR